MTVVEPTQRSLPDPPCVVVMGVSGTGKTTTARLLARRLGVPFADADDLHPRANIDKMASGIPLDDRDREPWLVAVGDWLRARDAEGTGGVMACSALKRRYRDLLRTAAPDTYFLLLTADREELLARLTGRTGHFMPAALLDSQLAALEPLQPGERGVALHGSRNAGHAVEVAMRSLREHAAERRPGR
ncbi:gluconokinase [Nocardia testacea]|uniref:Gluconokinase n=1 Tax=Nocardia testacea TaxID=248551 RepID=A0ABW7VSB2_9NOCA